MASSVTEIFQNPRRTLGETYSRMLFQMTVTDRGSEFTNPVRIEIDPKTGTIQRRVFYCDLMNSNQESNCERDHGLIWYVIPKSQAKEYYTEEEVCEMMNHIDPHSRKKWNGQAFIGPFVKIYGWEVAGLLGFKKAPSDSVYLTPVLLKRQAGNTYRKTEQYDRNVHPSEVHLQFR